VGLSKSKREGRIETNQKEKSEIGIIGTRLPEERNFTNHEKGGTRAQGRLKTSRGKGVTVFVRGLVAGNIFCFEGLRRRAGFFLDDDRHLGRLEKRERAMFVNQAGKRHASTEINKR